MDTKQMIEVLQAYERGERVQCRVASNEEWMDCALKSAAPTIVPTFSFGCHEYRIKPQPREWWINRYPGGGIGIYDSKELAEINKSLECIHVREVTE
jgi:hypothetical protein